MAIHSGRSRQARKPARKRPRMTIARKRPPAVTASLLARPGGAPVRTTPVEDLPRILPSRQPEPPSSVAKDDAAGGIKKVTVGTTLYLLPHEHKRIRQLALDLDVPSV